MIIRKKLFVQGIVQGVGFRPFVYRLAMNENLKGFVTNTPKGVEIEIQGDEDSVLRFVQRLHAELPPLASITSVDELSIPITDEADFHIIASRQETGRSTLISPDMSVCDDCLMEMFSPQDRRYRYPFINCTNCGPRYTIIQDVPYDRPKTTMSVFKMCPECQAEYDNPLNRRFHAQPNACPVCGPKVWLSDSKGVVMKSDDPILDAIRFLKEGKILAIKGLGGFHLSCDASHEDAVDQLRSRKLREEKPLAVMARDLKSISRFAEVSPHEEDLLQTPRRPIVLLLKKANHPLAPSVAPRNGYFGTMLPYTPLHYLLLEKEFDALVMTSGNLSEEPIAIDNDEALSRLGEIADVFLMHDRDIHLRGDDSVTRFTAGLPRIIRRSRGYAPMPVFLRKACPSVLAVGGELKNTLCVLKDERAFLSQHIGDLENLETLSFFEECVTHLRHILDIDPVAIVHDMHPDYLSTQWTLKQSEIPLIQVQHHHAHIASCLAENGRDERVIGLSLDGTGYGSDGHIWGGEVLICDLKSFERAAHFSYKKMPGGGLAIREPWRMAVSYLHSIYVRQFGDSQVKDFVRWLGPIPLLSEIPEEHIATIVQMMQKGINSPLTSSLGRLFDGVAAIIGLREHVAYEGQAAIELEMGMNHLPDKPSERYGFDLDLNQSPILVNPDAVILAIIDDLKKGIATGIISYKFHTALIQIFLDICHNLREQTQLNVVALSGGCFQNRFLLERLMAQLRSSGFDVLSHSQVPTNDGGLALGQAVLGAYQIG